MTTWSSLSLEQHTVLNVQLYLPEGDWSLKWLPGYFVFSIVVYLLIIHRNILGFSWSKFEIIICMQ
jgi:hypothetical protein